MNVDHSKKVGGQQKQYPTYGWQHSSLLVKKQLYGKVANVDMLVKEWCQWCIKHQTGMAQCTISSIKRKQKLRRKSNSKAEAKQAQGLYK